MRHNIPQTNNTREAESPSPYISLCQAEPSAPNHNTPRHLTPIRSSPPQNIHIGPRKIWLTRPAESVLSEYSDDYEVGEEVEELTEEGRRYSMAVAKYLQAEQVRCLASRSRLRLVGSCLGLL